MSVRSNGSGDRLADTFAHGITTGDFSLGIAVKLIADRNAFSDLIGLGSEETDPSSWVAIDTGSDGTTPNVFDNTSGGGDFAGSGGMSVGTWYYLVFRRIDSSDETNIALFTAAGGATPVITGAQVVGGATGSIATLDWLTIGTQFTGEWADAEFANLKFKSGIAWSNAQVWGEAQTLDEVAGGTYVMRTSLADVTTGLEDQSGNGFDLTNTGCVNGASDPDFLAGPSAAELAGTIRAPSGWVHGQAGLYRLPDPYVTVQFR